MMVLARTFDTKAVNLQRTGKLGTYPSCLGHEATHVGAGAALRAEDCIAPVYRDLLKEEQRPENRKDGLLRATDLLNAMLRERGIAYDEFVFAV